MRLALLLTGNELMTGDTLDSNSAMIAQLCLDEGIQVAYKVTVPDDFDVLISEIERLSHTCEVLIVNGGLGPTSDDLTAEALAKVINQPICLHEAALTHLKNWCVARNYDVTNGLSKANKKQAMLPSGIELIPNAVGSAVGFKVTHNQCLIMCTPGVPHELKKMLKQEILPELKAGLPATQQAKRVRYRVFGYGESQLQQMITERYPNWPAELELGFRASMPLLEVKLKVDSIEQYALLDQWKSNIEELLGEHIVTEDDRSLAKVVIDLLNEQGKTVTCAESCTGGKIASLLTEISGASSVFEAGFVTYSNNIKHQLLAVSEQDLEKQGAVSETVVEQMLAGALDKSQADIGVAVSGIAGPNGGSEEKPVGTVYVAWGSKGAIQAQAFYFPGSRIFFQEIVSALSLDLIRRELLGSLEQPIYFSKRKLKSGAK